MLTFESPFYEIEGVVLFRDHADPGLFHYLAGPPHLSTQGGEPSFQLLKYRNALEAEGEAPARDELGGGFLIFGVDCGLSDATLDAIRGKLAAYAPPGSGAVRLVPVLYTKGTVRVLALDAQTAVAEPPAEGAAPATPDTPQSRFVRGVLGTATPSLLDDQRAIFSIALSPEGVSLLEEAYDNALSPIGVIYELEFSGLRPALAVTGWVDMARCYESLKLGLTVGYSSGGGGGGTTTNPGTTTTTNPGTTTTTNPGTTTTTNPGTTTTTPNPGTTTTTNPGTTTTTNPGGGSGGGAQGGGSGGTRVALSADLSYTLEKLKEEGAMEIRIVRQQEGEDVATMEKNAMDLIKETILKDFFKPAMSTTPTQSTTTPQDALRTARGLTTTSGDTNNGRSSAGGLEIGFQLQYKKTEELKRWEFDFSVESPETRTHAPNGLFSALLDKTQRERHILEIDLDNAFFKVIEVETRAVDDFQRLDLKVIHAELQYGGTPADPVARGPAIFSPEDLAPKHFKAFRDGGGYAFRYQVTYAFGVSDAIAAQRYEYTTPMRSSVSRALVLNPSDDVAMLSVIVEPGVVDWDLVDKVEVRLRYQDTPNAFQAERTFLVGRDSTAQRWTVRLTDPTQRDYGVTYTWHMKDGSSRVGVEQTQQQSHLFVPDPFVDRIPVRILPQVDPETTGTVLVELAYKDADSSYELRKTVVLNGPQFAATTEYIPLMNAALREFSYAVQLLPKGGGAANVQAPKKTAAQNIVITDGIIIYHNLEIRLLGDMNALGVLAVQVDFQGEPPPGRPRKVYSHVFEPGAPTLHTERLMLRADRELSWDCTATAVLADGTTRVLEITGHTSRTLMLPLAQILHG